MYRSNKSITRTSVTILRQHSSYSNTYGCQHLHEQQLQQHHFSTTSSSCRLLDGTQAKLCQSSATVVPIASLPSSSNRMVHLRYFSTTDGVLRRRRTFRSHIPPTPDEMLGLTNTTKGQKFTGFGTFELPYDNKEVSTEAYLEKVSLSPWTPIPDVVARKMFDISNAQPQDIHVDLGSGDGRVNFHAIDYGLQKSIGIDIDENIVAIAKTRLTKRHPPPDIEFIVADLLDPNHPAWEKVQNATIITMYFATEGLKLFRPLLEAKLVGKVCTVITAGYEMPGWASAPLSEVVLGTQIHMYRWGGSAAGFPLVDDSLLPELPPEVKRNKEKVVRKINGMNVIDRTGGSDYEKFHLRLLEEDDSWGLDSDEDAAKDAAEGDDDDEDEDPEFFLDKK